jgi:bacillithiol biosynthesis cysteine-adding enzyme BshC
MDYIATRIPYRQTNAFSNIILDYLDHSPKLKPFYAQEASLKGIKNAIDQRKKFPTNRIALVDALKNQYQKVSPNEKTCLQIESLQNENTFAITTAHQNNIFTGPLYFIYKIIHAIRLSDFLNESFPNNHFVPVFYMGSEDADLDELNHVWLGGEKLVWDTKQKGAVGRMKIDKNLVKLVTSIEGQLSVLPHGNEIVRLVKECYREGQTIQDATFQFLDSLFAQFGLLVLLPDNAGLKAQMIPIFKDDLLHQSASEIVETAAEKLSGCGYKVQANPREINLFYLEDGIRERITNTGDKYTVLKTGKTFSKEEILHLLEQNPELFSPNVILRGLYQETILPNLVFIGGGGETAYWLQLKDLFDKYQVPFPILVLRNSFLLIEEKWREKWGKLGFTTDDLFLGEQELLNKLVERNTENKLRLNGTLTETTQLYEAIKKQATAVDITLEKHVESLKLRSIHRLQELEKKMLRAEKRKYADQQRQIHTIKEALFPNNGLQERVENFMGYYAKWGDDFFKEIYKHSLALEQEFVVIGV